MSNFVENNNSPNKISNLGHLSGSQRSRRKTNNTPSNRSFSQSAYSEQAAGSEFNYGSGNGGGGMDDLIRRIENLEQNQRTLHSELRDEIKDRVTSIDAPVRKIETDLAVLSTKTGMSNDSIVKSLEELKKSLSEIKSPITTLTTQMAEVNKDVGHLKDNQDKLVTNRKWAFTTGIAILGVMVAIYKVIFP
ncbi:hypothetical protein [Paenibacillus amylolyticus]|uniref:hypothetical protein n=1 Tax=Paenibacillus amylolyticus TaxID=1451 RepID=UPI0015C2DBB8|nr:hypothetical protein [Paenibacillus amylolyticus]